MITVRRLKDLLEKLPDEAAIYAYDGEDTGIGIEFIHSGKPSTYMWIRAKANGWDTYTEGF